MAGAALDHKNRPIVAVTGMGVVSSLGAGRKDNFAALTSGQSGIRTISRFPIDGMRTTMAGTVDFLDVPEFSAPALTERLAVTAGEEAIAQSGIGRIGDFPGPLFIGIPPVELEWQHRFDLYTKGTGGGGYGRLLDVACKGDYKNLHRLISFAGIEEAVSDHFGTIGAPISLTTACASGASAIQLGAEAIRRGETEAALCIAADGSVHAEAVIRFSLLSALSTRNDPPEKASKPFSKDRDGFVVAEGSGAFVLENLDSAKARGAEVLAIVAGCGEQADDFHRTRSKPDGSSIIGVFRDALADAGLEPGDIDHVNAHGTSTPENDKMEYMGLSTVFGDDLAGIPVSSNKSMIGHTISAAGAIEAVVSVMTMQNGRIPPTINHDVPDPDIQLDVVPNEARDADVSAVMSNSFGFGGQNVSLILRREPA